MAISADSPSQPNRLKKTPPILSQSSLGFSQDTWDLLPVIIWKLSAEGIVLGANRACRELLGYEAEEFINHPVDDFLVGSIDFKFLRKNIELLGRLANQEACLRCKDGSTRYVVIDAGSDLMGGSLREIFCAVSDHSLRKRTEVHAREQTELLLRNEEAIIIQNLEGLIIYWSMGAERLYGLPSFEAIGRPLPRELGEDRSILEFARRTVLERGEWRGEIQNTTTTGTSFAVESRWVLLRDQSGNPQSILVINEDAAESRLLEEERLRAQRQECIGNLAGGIAHDLNNILQPISIALDMFRSKLADNESQEVLEMLDSNVRRATELVRQILTFTSGVRQERQTVEAHSLFGEVANFVRQAFPKAIQLKVSVEDNLPSILGDQTQMEQVVLNLCVNARDAMRDGGHLRLEAKAFEVDESFAARQPLAKLGRYIRLSVSDSGEGIPRQIRKKIFEPFFTTKGPEKGTGLGLATVLGIIRRHGGFLTLETEEGCGSSFHVFIPAAPAENLPSSAKSPTARQESIQKGAGETILLVDDEATVLKVMQRSLEKSSYRVLTANDGEEGLALFKQYSEEIHLVITDISMPGMDGPEMVAAIHKISASVPILGTSGLDTKLDKETLRALGLRKILGKPCNPQTILQAIRQVLDEREIHTT
jgi:two-component system cell cycle sensor histidine kinase/response regulator CckA